MLDKVGKSNLEAIALGEQPSEVISQFLQYADFAINTGTPLHLGKSSTFAAMLEHGLPIVVADGICEQSEVDSRSTSVLRLSSKASCGRILDCKRVVNTHEGVTLVARRMLSLLEDASSRVEELGKAV